jgi:hypothetical protein
VALTAGATYSFKVTARNSVGDSAQSTAVTILAAKPPDAPLNFQNVEGLTTAYQVGVRWDDGSYDGSSEVIDYQLSYTTDGSDTWTVWASGLTSRTDIVTGLTPGQLYKFRVQSRNIVDFSQYSTEVSILAAQVPDVPTGLQNDDVITTGSQAGLFWTAPVFDGGSEITDYRVLFDNLGDTFVVLESSVASTSYIAIDLL